MKVDPTTARPFATPDLQANGPIDPDHGWPLSGGRSWRRARTEDSMDVLEAIRGRRAVRDYTDKAPSEAVVQSLIETATWAPSGVNLQPCLLYTSPSPRDRQKSRMPSSA